MILSLLYWGLRRLLELVVITLRSEEAKEVEILVLGHQLCVLKRQVKRPDLKPHDRAILAAASCVTPIKAPLANAFAERFVGTLRRECLDRILFGRGDLESTLRVYVEHYNGHRPHRALDMDPPAPSNPPSPVDDSSARVLRRDVLGGLIHEYEREPAA